LIICCRRSIGLLGHKIWLHQQLDTSKYLAAEALS
jgi:hypothetical protein